MTKQKENQKMAKTTKLVRGIHSWIKFQKHQGVESLSIEGKQALADLSQDKNGDTNLILNADADKLNTIHSAIPFISVSEEFSGVDPNQLKTATISQDLTLFPLQNGDLIKFEKQKESISVSEESLKNKLTELINEALTEVPVVLVYEHTLLDNYSRLETNINIGSYYPFFDFIEIILSGKNNNNERFIISTNELINGKQVHNTYVGSLLIETTSNHDVHITVNSHKDDERLHVTLKWFTQYKGQKILAINEVGQENHFEGYENPNVELTYQPLTPPSTTETPSAPSIGEFPRATFPMASTSPTPETTGNTPQPITDEPHEESH